MNAPAVFAKFITDSVDRDVAPLPTPYVARREQGELSGAEQREWRAGEGRIGRNGRELSVCEREGERRW